MRVIHLRVEAAAVQTLASDSAPSETLDAGISKLPMLKSNE